ncbi:ASCH domain-containing protein [Phytobacter sp. V91]|uniref:ASCH domain-containing protein n=1 Tax=Phytobacter sp. V91 TaxID=3369425 RepID=UPI003F5DBA71
MLNRLKERYPGAVSWAFGDSPEMADELVALVINGVKTATCSAFASYTDNDPLPQIGSYNILLNGSGEPVCVIRINTLCLVRFNEVTAERARKEGEGDLSLSYWQRGHQAFFTREGNFSEEMELLFEEFELVEIVQSI